MNKVSALSTLRISGRELKDNHYISFILLFKIYFYRYIGISVIFKSQHGFSIAGAGYTLKLPFLKSVFCVLNHKYIEWKCFLGIL